jgi:hypothetical protein
VRVRVRAKVRVTHPRLTTVSTVTANLNPF